jgi:hypothetical protein
LLASTPGVTTAFFIIQPGITVDIGGGTTVCGGGACPAGGYHSWSSKPYAVIAYANYGEFTEMFTHELAEGSQELLSPPEIRVNFSDSKSTLGGR